jgi:tetratricopeptide (TPR) repeat protein
MEKILFFFMVFFCTNSVFSQNKYVDSLRNVLASTIKPIDRFNILVKIGEDKLVLKGGAIDSAISIQLLKIAQQLKNDSLLAISYNWVGTYVGFVKGDNTAALEYYFKALPLAENAHDKRRISSLYFDIATIYFNLQNKEEAFKNVLKGGENLPDQTSPMYDFMVVQYLRNMAKYYLQANSYDSALHYAQALTGSTKKLKSLGYAFDALYLNGSAYAKMGDKEMAEVYFKKANAMSGLIQGRVFKFAFFQIYISFLLDNARIKEAKVAAEQLLELGRMDNNNNFKLSAAVFLQQAFDSLHQTDSAYYYAKMKDKLNASIFSQNNINKIQSIAFNEQLRTAEEAAKNAEQIQQRKENIQYALIAIGIIVLLMLYLLLSRSFITNAKLIEFFGVIALLIVFEFLNLLLHPFLETVTHHSPVLMLLGLVAIAALIVPLHHRLEHWTTKKLVEKNKSIRLAQAKKTIKNLDTNPE